MQPTVNELKIAFDILTRYGIDPNDIYKFIKKSFEPIKEIAKNERQETC